jgi:thioredoxin 1
MLAPVIEQIARMLAGRLKICKASVDENRGSAGRFGIMAVPTLILFKGETILERMEGAQPKESIIGRISRFL